MLNDEIKLKNSFFLIKCWRIVSNNEEKSKWECNKPIKIKIKKNLKLNF